MIHKLKHIFAANIMKNFDEDEFLKTCYPNIELGVLKCLANRIGYPEIFSCKYEKNKILCHIQLQENSFNDVLFKLSIYRSQFFNANQALRIIMHVDSTFSLNKRNIERTYFLEEKKKPKQISNIDEFKIQKSA